MQLEILLVLHTEYIITPYIGTLDLCMQRKYVSARGVDTENIEPQNQRQAYPAVS